MKATEKTPTGNGPTPVTFDTLKAVQDLRKSGFDNTQSEGIVTTISTAVSETVATRTDVILVRKDIDVVRNDIEVLRDKVESLHDKIAATDKKLEFLHDKIAAMDNKVESLYGRIDAQDGKFESVYDKIDSMHDKIVLKLGGLMVTLTFLMLAISPLYLRWLNTLLS